MIQNILSTILISLCLLLSFPAQAAEQEEPLPPSKRVLVVLVNQLSLEDIQKMQQMNEGGWLNRGVVGAMNLRTAGTMNEVNNLITLGSGVRAVGSGLAVQAYNGNDLVDGVAAKTLHRQLTGVEGETENIYVPGFLHIVKNNRDQPYTILPGLLGQTLHDHGLKTAVIGNSDKGREAVRFGPMLAMDQKGIVDMGDISSRTYRPSESMVYGITTDYPALHQLANDYSQKAALTVIELGDLHRLYSLKKGMDEFHFYQQKNGILEQIHQFMTELAAHQQMEELILLVSPMVNEDAQNSKSLMSPFVLLSPKEGAGGTMISSTTRQRGIVGNVDIAPTILEWLGLPLPYEMVGRPVRLVGEPFAFWGEWKRINHIYSTRSEILYSYVSFQIFALLVAAGLWMYGFGNHPAYDFAIRFVRLLLIMLTLSPFFFLMLPLVGHLLPAKMTLVMLFLLGFALSAALGRLPFLWIFFIVSLLNWVPVLADGLIGQSDLMKRSYLGYDPIIGARYYGIGNEYMGVVIGSSILCFAVLLELVKERIYIIKGIAISVFTGYLLYLGLPQWGTNAGGMFTAAAAYTTSFVRLFDIPLNRKFMFWAILAVVLVMSSLLLMNMLGGDDSQSHIGRAMDKMVQGEWTEISHIVKRKLEMNWKLIQVSSWSKVFITSLLVLGLLCYRPAGTIKRLSENHPYVFRGFFGIIVGAFTGLLLNDSGIVAAATTIIYMISPLLYFGLSEKTG